MLFFPLTVNMPRTYKPKEKHYKTEIVEKALQEVAEGASSVRAIARKYGLQKDLLNNRLKGIGSKKAGRKTALSIAEETEIGTSIKIMAKWGFGLSKEEIKDCIQDYVRKHHINVPFREGRPGDDWFTGFTKRQRLSLKKPEPLELKRQQITSDPFIIYHFYDLLKEEIQKLDLENRPECIFNLDETSFPNAPSKTKAVSEIGQPSHRKNHGSLKENTTVLACVNANGDALPPLIVFEASNLWSTWKGSEEQGMVPGTFFGVSQSGWMTSQVFYDYFKLFIQIVKQRPILMIFDGHMSHLSLQTIELARSNNVSILKLPPHTTDILQPLDRSCFRPLKILFDKKLATWERENSDKMNKADFSNILGQVWLSGLTKKNILSGFSSTGIYPVNSTAYPVSRLNPDKLQRYNMLHRLSAASEAESEAELEFGEKQNNTLTCDRATSTPLLDMQEKASTPRKSPRKLGVNSTGNKSFEEILLSKITPRHTVQGKRRKIDMDAAVITSDDYMKQIKLKEGKNIPKTKAKTSSKKNILSEESGSSPEDESCDSDTFTDISFPDNPFINDIEKPALPRNPRQLKLHLKNVIKKITCDKFFAVYYESSYYIGKVLKIYKENEKIEHLDMKFLKWYGDNKFWWPATPDIEKVPVAFIFYGPVQTDSVDPFKISSKDEIADLYRVFKKLHKDVFVNELTKVN